VIEHAEVCRRLEHEIELNGSLTRAARYLGISPQYLSAVLGGSRAIGPKLLRSMKLRRKVVKVVTYREVTRAAKR
jgi:hypothetical protein